MKTAEEAAKKDVFVTVCDQRDIDSAKQLFAAAATKGRWKGDYCLICRDLEDSDIRWFEAKGVIVMAVDPVIPEKTWAGHSRLEMYPQVSMLKTYIFTEAFRRWDSVVYADTDILIRDSILHLANVTAFSAMSDDSPSIDGQYLEPTAERTLPDKEILRMKAFNAGVLAFPTESIGEKTFEDIKNIALRTLNSAKYSDQSFLNVHFAGNWKRLPAENNILMNSYRLLLSKREDRILREGRIVHFTGPFKPSLPDNPGYPEWKENLRAAENASSFSKMELSDAKRPLSSSRSVERVHSRIRIYLRFAVPVRRFRRFSRNPAEVVRRRLSILNPDFKEAD